MNATASEATAAQEAEVEGATDSGAAPAKAAAADAPPPKKCPECRAGAPGWMATFADMATLLLCFFVLILSFAEMNVPKYKQISGSMKAAFGVQKDIPVVEQPKGTTILSLSFSPSPTMALVDNLKQETTDTTQEEIEVREKDQDLRTEALYEAAGRRPVDSQRPGAQGGSAPDSVEQDAAKLKEALSAEIAAGVAEVKATSTRVTVEFNAKENAPRAARLAAAQAVAAGVKKVSEVVDELQSEVAITGATQALIASVESQPAAGQSEGGSGKGGGSAEKVEAAAKAFEAAFSGEIKEGLVKVERKDGAVTVKIGSGGAFATGDAALTPLATQIIEKIGDVANSVNAKVVIGGHTDNVPIRTVKYRDNWDLSAARAVSVVRELVTARRFDPARIEAQGFADTKPVAANDSPENRALNRRIEIEVRLPEV
ncbi:MAG: flagellar motor protein MotB [Gammaproteobacteria bacterium]|nr:flagellar motor protein MotB [Gammaproteobacteria bacterium]